MAQFDNSIIDEIKDRCNIVEYIGRYVELKRTGNNYKGLCPFHNEKTPSFIVSESKQLFNCFGCGVKGDVITFAMRYHRLEFPEALEMLAEQYGIEYKSQKKKSLDRYYEVNKQAAYFFLNAIKVPGNPGAKYMAERRISPETMIKFGIGYADSGWSSLYDYLKSIKGDVEAAIELGLLARSRKSGKVYDVFRDRVMFPIVNLKKKVIGFGGRTLVGDDRKYLNSPESPVFLKKNTIYGFNVSRNAIFDTSDRSFILVEGYMDVISLYQSGIMNVGASLGTALTENQARLLKRNCQKVILSYDADDAGRKAALRGVEVLKHEDIDVRVLHVDDGKDPDEYVKKHGKLGYLGLIENAALRGTDYMVESIRRKYGNLTGDPGERERFLKETLDMVSKLDSIQTEEYLERLSQEFDFSKEALRDYIKGAEDKNAAFQRKREEKPAPKITRREKFFIYQALLSRDNCNRLRTLNEEFKHDFEMMILEGEKEEALTNISEAINIFASESGSRLFSAITDYYDRDDDIEYIDPEVLKDNLGDSERTLIDEIEKEEKGLLLDQNMEEGLAAAKIESLKHISQKLNQQMDEADSLGNGQLAGRLQIIAGKVNEIINTKDLRKMSLNGEGKGNYSNHG